MFKEEIPRFQRILISYFITKVYSEKQALVIKNGIKEP